MYLLVASILLPIVFIGVFYRLYPHKIAWWEITIPVIPSFIIIPLFLFLGEMSQTKDYERLGGICLKVERIEEWNEEVPCSHPIYQEVQTGTDSNGNPTYASVYVGDEHLYDVEHHPEQRLAYGSNGERKGLTTNQYNWAANRFGNQLFVDMHRDYHSIDGDKYEATWNHKDKTFIPIFTTGSYKNKILPNDGLFEFKSLQPNEIKRVHEWTKITNVFNDPVILGYNDNKADSILQKFNATQGEKLQIRLWVLLYENEGREVAYLQQSHWKGFNKNEFVVCIGKDKNNKVLWNENFCWSPDGYAGNHELKIKIRDFIENQDQLDLLSISEFIVKTVPEKWKRKPFQEFEYLTIPVPTWAIITTYLVTILTSCTTGYFIINNEYNK